MERRLAAILAMDVVGYSRLIRADEEGTITALQALRANLTDPIPDRNKGRIVKLMGDGMLVEFASVVDAVRAAAETQEALAQYNGDTPDGSRIVFRAGVNLGDVVIDGDDIHGDGVNVAARLESLAVPGGICISASVYEQVRDRLDLRFEDLGEKQVKNIARPIRVWQWRPSSLDAQSTAPSDPELSQPDKPAIAVLPFANMSSDADQAYFSDGITEDIITAISRFPELMVISRNSTFTYKGKAAKAQDVCRDLGVHYVLEGSVRRAGDRVRITAQLIDGRSGGHLWAERYDRQLEDVFAVQDEVTEQIVGALEVRLVGDAQTGAALEQPRVPEAYDCVLRGREQYRLFTKEGNNAARTLYERAIELDPDYGEPYAGLAETYVQDWLSGTEPALDRAFRLARQAEARSPTLPLVQEALSTVHLFKRQQAEAVSSARRWTELEPSNADAYAALAAALHFAGDNKQVVALIDKAMRLNPRYPFYYPHYAGMANLAMRRCDVAATALTRAIARNPDALWPHVVLAACYGYLDQQEDIQQQLSEIKRIKPEFSVASLQKLLPYRHSTDLEHMIDGLRKAGLADGT